MASVNDTELVVTGSVRIPLAEIELKTSRSSGPGGQHANKTSSRVEAVFHIATSGALTPAQRERSIGRLGPVVRAVSQDARSQTRNRELALIRLGEKLEAALKVSRSRVATKPTRSSQTERVARKRARGETKSQRRKPSTDD